MHKIEEIVNKVICADCLEFMRDMPDECVDCVVTSPPYYGLRDYGVDGQIGLEPTMKEYIARLAEVFGECKRVLKKTGTIWINIGDSYGGSNSGGIEDTKAARHGTGATSLGNHRPTAILPPKSLCQIPERLSIALTDDESMDWWELDKGFILSNLNAVTDNKPNATQRPGNQTEVHEGICKEISSRTSGGIQSSFIGVVSQKQGRDSSQKESVLLGEQGKGNHASNEIRPQTSSHAETKNIDTLRRQSTEVQMLSGAQNTISDNGSHGRMREGTTQRSTEMRFDIRMVETGEVPNELQSFMYELQFCDRQIWVLPPSGRRNLRLRRKDIPEKILKYFQLHKEERWIKRNTIIWWKRNCMPSSVNDRFTVDFEYLYFYTKSGRYWFEQQFEDLAYSTAMDPRMNGGFTTNRPERGYVGARQQGSGLLKPNPQGRNKRTVWDIPTESSGDAHFAVFPRALVYTPIKAGCPPNGIVLDPFAGSGTTCLEAKEQGKNYIGIELNPEYLNIAEKRLRQEVLPLGYVQGALK